MLFSPETSSERNLQRVNQVITHELAHQVCHLVSFDFTNVLWSFFVDMIAIPDFAAGAMENWGLITYREAGMLFQPGMSSERNLQKVTTLLTHEVGHQVGIMYNN